MLISSRITSSHCIFFYTGHPGQVLNRSAATGGLYILSLLIHQKILSIVVSNLTTVNFKHLIYVLSHQPSDKNVQLRFLSN